MKEEYRSEMTREYRWKMMRLILNGEHLHALMHKIVDVIMSYATQDPEDFSRPYLRLSKNASLDRADEYSKPIVGFINGQPHAIETPWGGWQCFDASRSETGASAGKQDNQSERQLWEMIMPELTERLGLQVDRSYEEDDHEYKLEYIYYTLSKVDDESLLEYYVHVIPYHAFFDPETLISRARETALTSDLYDAKETFWEQLEDDRKANCWLEGM